MAGNPAVAAGDLPGGATERDSSATKLRFDGLATGNGAVTLEQRSGKEGAPDPRVSSVAGVNGARYKSMSPARLPITRSPCLTIPPGFSPSALLESPVLLTSIKAEPSPTTGSLNMFSVMDKAVHSNTSSTFKDASDIRASDGGSSVDFEFKPHTKESCNSHLSSVGPLASLGSKQEVHEHCIQVQSQTQGQTGGFSMHELTQSTKYPNAAIEIPETIVSLPAEVASDELRLTASSEKSTQVLQSDGGESTPSNLLEKSMEDGYNWRKYGQKYVKGSEYPRSYYKCTHPNCQMKKQLERSHDGQITEIIYKGRHDHPKPQPTHRLAVGAILSNQGEDKSERLPSFMSTEEKSPSGSSHISHQIEPNVTTELSPASASDDEIEVGVGQSKSCDEIANKDSEAKRRKTDTACIDASSIGKMNREPRVVVQTVSEVDILDDGYRWRKYGQKVVKGNPNPRSYYKCTSAGCPVRKHVERASHDPKAVITTYEGKHNHDVPAARTASHEIPTSMVLEGLSAMTNHMSATLTGIIGTSSTRVISHPCTVQQENDTISLDLGVGISRNQSNMGDQRQQFLSTNQIHHHQASASSDCSMVVQAKSISTLYPSSNSGNYESRENKGEIFTFNTPAMDRSSTLYYTST